MHFSIPAILTLLLAGSQAVPTSPPPAIRIPQGQSDGSYLVHHWGARQELHERLPDPTDQELQATLIPRPQLFKRDDYIACGCVDLDHRDCDDATHGVELWADKVHTIQPDLCFYNIARSVVAFICVPKANGNTIPFSINSDDAKRSWKHITDSCGRYKAGSEGWKPAHVTGYMTSDHGDYFGDAWKSPRTSC
ncbi:hypothetical protein PG991_012298 [Apiospora marii]|uniref:Ecp2 effector protein domain-containing protein n=1 Tax=Apiospora marii TaxID=335849 RepID=A0ABR1R9I8_9PEZI